MRHEVRHNAYLLGAFALFLVLSNPMLSSFFPFLFFFLPVFTVIYIGLDTIESSSDPMKVFLHFFKVLSN